MNKSQIPKEIQKAQARVSKYLEQLPQSRIWKLSSIQNIEKVKKNTSIEKQRLVQEETKKIIDFNEKFTNREWLSPGCDPNFDDNPVQSWENSWKYVKQMEKKTKNEIDNLWNIVSLFQDILKVNTEVLFIQEDIQHIVYLLKNTST
jgi:hypothetical protein